MIKRVTVSLIILCLLASFGFTKSKKVGQISAKKVDPNSKVIVNNFVKKERKLNKTSDANQLIFTSYDYAGNNTIPNMLDMYDFTGDGVPDVVAVAMQRFGATSSNREVRMIVGNPTDGFTNFSASAADSGAGWGTLNIADAGPLDGNALVMYHQGGNSWLTKVNLKDPNLTVTLSNSSLIEGTFPSFVYMDNGNIFANSYYAEVFKSEDQGSTFNSIGEYFDPSDLPIFDNGTSSGYPSEYILKKSPNGKYLFNVDTWTAGDPSNGGNNGGPGGAPVDSTDYVGINYSTDSGSTWAFEVIGRDGITPVANRPGYYPLFANFGQVNGVVDNNGVIHITANGYGYWLDGIDTLVACPALYWNSRDKQWLAVSDTLVEHDLDNIFGPGVNDKYWPGNGLGNAYATPSISPDGQNIVVIYQGPEYPGTPGATAPNLFATTTTNPDEKYYTDLYYAVSNDGGKTWNQPKLVPNASSQNVQESYPSPAQWLYDNGDNTGTVNLLFMIDDIPGTSLFDNENSANDNSSWNYTSFSVATITGVEDQSYKVNSFKLEQNYPNPFNPSTIIKYTISERSNVSLKVYDVLGKEVASLINEVKDANNYEVKFDASNLASGLYIYKLQAGDFTSSRKMMLLK